MLGRLKHIFLHKALILMYHRIATPETDPWELAVSPDHFEQHLQVLQQHKGVMPLSNLVQQLQHHKLKRRCLAVTFDDGYLDNYLTAKPLLEKYHIPATFFITSKNIDSKNEFWWDEIEQIIVHTPELPQQLSFHFNDEDFHFDLENETVLTPELQSKVRNYVAYDPPTLRTQLYFKLWQLFSPLPSYDQEKLLNIIREWAGVAASSRTEFTCMSLKQLKDLAAHPLFEIGGHTATHPALSNHPKEVQLKEVTANKLFLENKSGNKINLFAYPSGNYNDITLSVLQQAGFDAAFTTATRPVTKGDDFFKLSRFQVNNWNGKKFEEMIEKWFKS